MSTYEGEHTIFGFLSQANLTQNDVLQLSEENTRLLEEEHGESYYVQVSGFRL
jgi:hypothetical protein